MLVEHEDPRVRSLLERQLAEHGYRVATCAGPLGEGPPPRCPLLAGEHCTAVDEADAVISGLDLAHPANRQLATALADDPERPLVVTPNLRVDTSAGATFSDHTWHRTIVAPLVRRLHDLLWSPTGRSGSPVR